MVDPYDDPKTTAAMCDAIDDAYPVTTLEQQAVPVAQEDREAAANMHAYIMRELGDAAPGKHLCDIMTERMRTGWHDDSEGVQAFARHRLASLPCKSGEGAGALAALVGVYTNARFRWLGRDCCTVVEQALKTIRHDQPLEAEQSRPCDEIDDCAGLRGFITDDQFESLFVALHRIKCNPSMDEIALVMPEVAAIFLPPVPDATQTREAELVEALEPFVKHWQPWMDLEDNGVPNFPDTNEMSCFARVTYGDLRRARAALNGRGEA